MPGSPRSKDAEGRIAAALREGSTDLDLSRLRLTGLPDNLGNLASLTKLNLSGNELTELPDWLGTLTSLTELNLSENHLTELPDGLGKLTGLWRLDLGGNRLRELPRWLGNLTSLAILELNRNDLTALPVSLGNLTSLRALQLGGSGLRELPGWLGNLTNLRWLGIGNVGLRELPGWLGNLTKLKTLDLGLNGLTVLPDWLGNLMSLTELDLMVNELTELPVSLGNLTSLTDLTLSGNRLTVLPDSLGNLTSLTALNLSNNQLTALPDSLGDLTNLKALILRDNPLESPPPEVVAQGTEAVLAFLRANRGGLVRQWASKLLVVGEGRTGKTSLVKALSGQPHDPAELTTHGLIVSLLPVPHPEEAGEVMGLSAWDFGGQDVYHAVHQFFLTGRSLFVLVWNAGEGAERGRLRYWLDIITARAPGAPVLIAATHTADRPADIDLAGLRADYPAIAGHFSIDCRTRTGIVELAAAIALAAAGLPLMGAQWPRRWAEAADALAADARPFAPAEDICRVMAGVGVTDPGEQATLGLALHHRGEILHYADDEELAGTVILDPQWLNVRIARILDHHDVAARDGVLTTAEIDQAWQDAPRALREHLLTLMDRFDISYRVTGGQDGAKAVVVGWLPQSPPDYAPAWDALADQNEIRVTYQLPVLPPGIPGWFLAREHRFATTYRWRTGAILTHPDGQHTALIRTDTTRNRISLAVRGQLPAGFFAVLDDGLNLTFDRYPGLDITRHVPCRGHGPCTKEFDYEKLTDRLRRGHHDIYCDTAETTVDITRLLIGITPPARDVSAARLEQLIATGFDQLSARLVYDAALAQREFLRLTTLIQKTQQAHCPSVFLITPARKRPGKTIYTLRLYCEEPGNWHPLPGDTGCYEISELANWLRTAGPWLTRTLHILKAAIPYAGPILGITASELQQQLASDLDLATLILGQIPDALADDQPRQFAAGGPVRRADIDADVRELRAKLLTLDPAERWGRLSHKLTPEGLSLYLCPEHLAAYEHLPTA